AAHSDIFVFPKIKAPFALSFFTISASSPITQSLSATVPALVGIVAVPMLSFKTTGMPYKADLFVSAN
ncbi:apolipoprotein N-acyltransferase, partial [Listeria monocytogenes FSL F2-208]